jgi:hypothetical protein
MESADKSASTDVNSTEDPMENNVSQPETAEESAQAVAVTEVNPTRPPLDSLGEERRKRLKDLEAIIWPDQLAKDEFTRLSGFAPHERDPFNSPKFRLLFDGYKKMTKETAKDRAYLFASAIEAITRKSVSVLTVPQKKAKSKRKKRSAASAEAPNPKKLAQGEGLPLATSPGLDKDTSLQTPTDPILDDDMTLDDKFIYEVTEQKKEWPKSFHKFLLQVYEKGTEDEDRIPIPTAELRAVFDKLQEASYNRMEEGLALPQVLWYARSKEGAGLIACANEESQSIIKMIVHEIKLGDKNYKAWDRSEFGFVTITLLLKHVLARKTFLDSTLFEAIKKQNKIMDDEDQVKFKDSTWTGDNDEVRVFRLQVTFEILRKLKKSGGKLFLLMSNIEIHKGGFPICPS